MRRTSKVVQGHVPVKTKAHDNDIVVMRFFIKIIHKTAYKTAYLN
jgi:hypothetical protein